MDFAYSLKVSVTTCAKRDRHTASNWYAIDLDFGQEAAIMATTDHAESLHSNSSVRIIGENLKTGCRLRKPKQVKSHYLGMQRWYSHMQAVRYTVANTVGALAHSECT